MSASRRGNWGRLAGDSQADCSIGRRQCDPVRAELDDPATPRACNLRTVLQVRLPRSTASAVCRCKRWIRAPEAAREVF